MGSSASVLRSEQYNVDTVSYNFFRVVITISLFGISTSAHNQRYSISVCVYMYTYLYMHTHIDSNKAFHVKQECVLMY